MIGPNRHGKPTDVNGWPATVRATAAPARVVAFCLQCEWSRIGRAAKWWAVSHAHHFGHAVEVQQTECAVVTKAQPTTEGGSK